ncbi:MAG: hypothetical protein J5482_06545 [Oscillospiraceae bacterium]|nr:hypothetical protein [Oscillospiraceae bacterium]
MDRYTDEELDRLIGSEESLPDETYTLASILEEFGQGAAKPAREKTESPVPPVKEEKAGAAPSLLEGIDTGDLRHVVAQTMEQVMAGKSATAQPKLPQREPNREEPPEPPVRSTIFPEEPEGMHSIPLEQVMSDTVEAVLDEDDAILEPPRPLGERIRDTLLLWRDWVFDRLPRRGAGDNSLWEQPEEEPIAVPEEPEPDMADAAREERLLCKQLHRHTVLAALPALFLSALAVLDGIGVLNSLWDELPPARSFLPGGLLLLCAALALPMWRELVETWKRGRIGCELSAALTAFVALADCVYGLINGCTRTPLAAPAALLILLCQWGLLLRHNARRETFRLADIGGTPPYGVSVTAAGSCKQKGTLTGLYRTSVQDDPARRWQRFLVPLYLAGATVLSGIVGLSGGRSGELLWIWSVLLTATVPFALPLTGTLPMNFLSRRLAGSGSAVAGYQGARAVSRSRRMVITDDDVFPPGTVGLNGLKIYGEEIGKVVSYAASMTLESHSQLFPLFEQLLTAEGGSHLTVEDLHYYEEGGVGGTIRGESVTMGSAYFMRKKHVTLPQGLKLKTGVFLAVDGVLIAVFAIKYQPSRNVEWALRAMRRNRVEPVLAARSCNVTPGLLRRKFGMDAKPVYPDVSTRLALGDLGRETAEKPGAVVYREGLMPFAEVVVGSRRMTRAVHASTVLAYLGGLCGLLLTYYLTATGAWSLLDPLRLLVYQALWLLPTWFLSGLVRHY